MGFRFRRHLPRPQLTNDVVMKEGLSDYMCGAFGHSYPVTRDSTCDLNSYSNKQSMATLQEIFPNFDVDMLRDVFVSAQYSLDTAAGMLSELQSEQAETDIVMVNWEEDAEFTQWHDINASRPEIEQWVVVPDEWEVLETIPQEKPPSFADVLRRGSSPSIQPLPSLQGTTFSSAIVSKPYKNKKFTDQICNEELCVKSFGLKKRRYLHKSRKFST